jgi:hypothetical protein
VIRISLESPEVDGVGWTSLAVFLTDSLFLGGAYSFRVRCVARQFLRGSDEGAAR